MTAIDPTSGAVENTVQLDDRRGTSVQNPPLLLPDGRVLLGLGTAEAMPRFEWKHSYALYLLDPGTPGEGAILGRYTPPRDGVSRYLHLLNVVGKYAVAVDEARGVAVIDLDSFQQVAWDPRIGLGERDDDAYLDQPQPRHDSLLLLMTRAGPDDKPARLCAYDVPDLRPKFALPLTELPGERASLVESHGVIAVRVEARRRRSDEPRIRLYDPVTAKTLQEIRPLENEQARDVQWLNAKVQNGILVVTTSANVVYGYGAR